MRPQSFWLALVALVWWVIPAVMFVITANVAGKSHLALGVLTLFAAAGVGVIIGDNFARWQHGDRFQSALFWAMATLLLSAAPIAIFIVG